MTLAHLNRRVHLYLGLALLPWFFMYGLSSVPFAHNPYFERREAALDVPITDDPEGLRRLGRRLLQEAGIQDMSFGVYRQNPTQINVYAYSFWQSTQVKYFTEGKRYTVEDRRFRWDQFLTGMHARGGFEQDDPLVTSWSVIVDIVQIGILLWIASGLWMWWDLRGHRRWGALAIAAGLGTFVLFTLGL
jgi:hypothetical protein